MTKVKYEPPSFCSPPCSQPLSCQVKEESSHSWRPPIPLALEIRRSKHGRRLCQWRPNPPDATPCLRFAQGSTKFCIRHSGGRQCETPGCQKSAQGVTHRCIACGGGRRCEYPNCEAAARGTGQKSFCSRHGGGARCALDPCSRGAQRPSDFCTRHGKAVTCALDDCDKIVAGGRGHFCKLHSNL
jgi:hypothetical protein